MDWLTLIVLVALVGAYVLIGATWLVYWKTRRDVSSELDDLARTLAAAVRHLPPATQRELLAELRAGRN